MSTVITRIRANYATRPAGTCAAGVGLFRACVGVLRGGVLAGGIIDLAALAPSITVARPPIVGPLGGVSVIKAGVVSPLMPDLTGGVRRGAVRAAAISTGGPLGTF